jgi:hypothetical protein
VKQDSRVREILDLWGEPKTMARVMGTVEECFPRPQRRGYNVWVDRTGRHVAVRFARDVVIEEVAPTWSEAILAVCEAKSKSPREKAR